MPRSLLAWFGVEAYPAQVTNEIYDVIVLGGGPGGAMAGGLLARRGHRVAIVERAGFPRFHIGESMLPQSLSVLERAGALDAVRAAGFVRKNGAAFMSADGRRTARFDFSKGFPASEHPHAFQVDRATFDHVLLTWAAAQGATVLSRTEAATVRGRSQCALPGLGEVINQERNFTRGLLPRSACDAASRCTTGARYARNGRSTRVHRAA